MDKLIRNSTAELEEKSVCREFRHTAKDKLFISDFDKLLPNIENDEKH